MYWVNLSSCTLDNVSIWSAAFTLCGGFAYNKKTGFRGLLMSLIISRWGATYNTAVVTTHEAFLYLLIIFL